MKNSEFGVITFKSTHHAIKGESIFKKEDIKFRMIPTPREVTHSCGLSIKFDLKNISEVKDIIDRNEVDIDGLFKLIKDEKGNSSEKLN
ncbi:MAG: DUF3343 domain-containing protein [Tissierellia bacterium]|nr:DUF3343 domain-containing protein [Tissierellia bacterium]